MTSPTPPEDADPSSADDVVTRWAESGLLSLTGTADGPGLGPPAPLVPLAAELGERIAVSSAAIGTGVHVDVLGLLAERAAVSGLGRRGRTSCGAATRLMPSADGWVAVSLARTSDVDLVPAWLGLLGAAADHADRPVTVGEDVWAVLADVASTRTGSEFVAAGATLGLAVASLGETAPRSAGAVDHVGVRHLPIVRPDRSPAPLGSLRVVDLSSLWAGPLCGAMFASTGADVIKVESTRRPDGARSGPQDFFDLLNADKRSVALDLADERGRHSLHRLVQSADVVIEASRPRALEQLGLDARELLEHFRPRVWISITGHGRGDGVSDRVAFGDDAAVAAGLVSWDGETPVFCGDAIADPLTGLAAAAAALEHLHLGDGTWLLDVAMSQVARSAVGPTVEVPSTVVATAPRRRRSARRAAPSGRDTAEVLNELVP
jgi:crotonobetainyl-CoA:carnitine CoA-transferase CaiB-like acyl-CoA transferase